MQQVGRSYVRRFNSRWSRNGTLWEGRYRAYWVEEAVFGLSVQRAIEWCAVREGLVSGPREWRWSSAAIHLGEQVEPRLSPLPSYWVLGNTPFEREAAYPSLLDQVVTEGTWEQIRKGLASGRPWITPESFVQLSPEERERWVRRPRGRPARSAP